MNQELKNELIKSLSINFGYEKAIEVIESIEYIDELNDEKVNTIIEFLYTLNNNLVFQIIDLQKTSNDLLFFFKKEKNFSKVLYYIMLILSIIFIITIKTL